MQGEKLVVGMRLNDGFPRGYEFKAHQETQDYTHYKESHNGVKVQEGYPFMVEGKNPRPYSCSSLEKCLI
jgi:hypothetical protein